MDGVSAIGQRIGQIHSLIASLDPRAGLPVAGTATATTAASSATVPQGSAAGIGSLAATAGYGTSFATGAGPAADATFAGVLAQATRGPDGLASAAAALNADGVPLVLAGYGNGLIPTSQLTTVGGTGERLWGPAAAHLERLLADARAAGHEIGVTDGYRDYDSQVRVAESKGLYRNGGLAAVPGTSQHGWGLAVDLSLDPSAQAWMRDHADEYGFVEAVAREPWHWEFQPGR